MKKLTITKDNLALKVAPIVAAISMIIYSILVIFSNSKNRILISNIFFIVPIAVTNFIIVYSYLKHNKNTMKSLIGFILSGLVLLMMHFAFYGYQPTQWFYIVKTILFVLVCIFALNQFLLSNDHYSRPFILFINQIIMDLLILIGVVGAIIDAIQTNGNPTILICLMLFAIATMYITLDIEMKVNEFKVKREEKGYVFEKSTTTEEVLDEEDMFIKNGVFYSLPGIVAGGLVILIIFNAVFDQVITWGYSIRYLIYLIKAICLLTLVLTYRSHNKNVMKVMLGFLLGTLLFENIFEITCLSSKDLANVKSIVTIAMVAVNVIFLITHLQLTRTHASNDQVVKVMKVSYLLYLVLAIGVVIGCSIYYAIGQGNNYIAFIFKPLIWLLGTLPVYTGILTIDTRVNGFKIKRGQVK